MRRRGGAGGLAVRSLVVLAIGVIAAGCAAPEGEVATFPPASIGPDRTVSPAVNLTRVAIEDALREHSLSMVPAQVGFRPAEGQRLADAPRAVYQVVLPADPGGGFLVVYELADSDLANQAAHDQASYLATGPGRVQSSLSSVDVIRVVGSTVVLYSWIPDDARDPATPGIQAALETIGLGVDIPS
jgi:hypothetical protein